MQRDSSPAGAVVGRLAADETAARGIADALAEILDPQDAACAAIADPTGSWGVEITFREPPDETAVRSVVALVAGAEWGKALRFAPLPEKDWVSVSLDGLGPVSAGRFVVHGAHSRNQVAVNRLGIEIEAAQAFGTGHHGTTRGCLLALDGLAKRSGHVGQCSRTTGRPLRILDLGTGSGVLAIAAAKRFRARVLASDLDQQAVVTARGNARLNRVGTLVEVIQAAGVSRRRFRDGGGYDLILANVLLRPLQRLAAPLARLAAPGAHVVLSGLLPDQMSAALASYRSQGLVLERRLILENWATLVLVRPPGRR